MKFIVRDAAAADYIAISKLNSEVHNLHVKNRSDVYVDTDAPFLKEYFNDLLNSESIKVLVVENTDNKELAAYSIVKIMSTPSIPVLIPRKIAFIDDFCVKSDCKKKGIGRLLFQHIIGYVKTEGVSSLQLVVWEFNKDAIGFYEAMGMSTRNRRMEIDL